MASSRLDVSGLAEDWCLQSASLQACSREIKRLQQKRRREESRDGRCGLGHLTARAVLAAYVLSGHNADLAGKLIKTSASLSARSVAGRGDFAQAVEDMYGAASQRTLDCIRAPKTDFDRKALDLAHKFLAEAAVFEWVKEQNFTKGVAPSTSDAAAQLRRQQPCPVGRTLLLSNPRKVRKWARGLGKRWGIRRGTLQRKEILPRDVIVQKAGGVFVMSSLIFPSSPSHFFAYFWACFWGHISALFLGLA